MKNGKGVLIFGKNNEYFSKYEGSFEEDQFHGEGNLYFKNVNHFY